MQIMRYTLYSLILFFPTSLRYDSSPWLPVFNVNKIYMIDSRQSSMMSSEWVREKLEALAPFDFFGYLSRKKNFFYSYYIHHLKDKAVCTSFGKSLRTLVSKIWKSNVCHYRCLFFVDKLYCCKC